MTRVHLAIGCSLLMVSIGTETSLAQSGVRNLDSETAKIRVYEGVLDGTRSAQFVLSVAAHRPLKIDVMGEDPSVNDPLLRVWDGDKLLITDDDGGDGYNSRAYVSVDTDRQLRLEVTDAVYDTEGQFNFKLSIEPAGSLPPKPRPIVLDAPALTGEFSDNHVHLFNFEAQQGQLLQIDLVGEVAGRLDPYVELRRGYDVEGEVLASNDDSGGSIDSQLLYLVTEAGPYTIAAYGVGNGPGDYSVSVKTIHPAETVTLGLDEPVTFTVSQADDLLGGAPFRLSPATLERIRGGLATMQVGVARTDDGTDGAVAVIEIGFETPLGFAVVRASDPNSSAGGWLAFDLARLGQGDLLDRLRIRVRNSYNSPSEYRILLFSGSKG